MPRPITVSYRISPSPAAVAEAAAELFRRAAVTAAETRNVARIAISGGSTPKAMFQLLADPSKPYLRDIPWDRLELFWVDERTVGPTDPDSNYRMTNEAMLQHVPLAADHIHRIEGELEPTVAAARYESTIRNVFKLEGAQTPTFDLVLLGMGDDGHTASLFPHTEAIHEMSAIVTANAVPQKDTTRITLTWPVINAGREVAFLIEGAAKAAVLRSVLLGDYDPETKPSQLIRPTNGHLIVLLDAAAAAELPKPVAVREDGAYWGELELN